jgi:hypothetical protein
MAAKKKTAAKRAVKPGKAVNPLADPALKARYQQELERFQNAQTGEMAGWDEMYEALDAILYSDPPLYLAASLKTARAFLAEHLPGVSEPTARGNIRVARSFDPADEQKYGISKLSLLLDYLEASGSGQLEPGIKINPDRTTIVIPHGKGTRKVLFPALSYDDLRAAVRSAKSAKPSSRTSDPPEVKTIREELRKAHLTSVAVRMRGKKLDFTGVGVGEIASLGRALQKVRLK